MKAQENTCVWSVMFNRRLPSSFITGKTALKRVKHLPKIIYTFRGRVLVADLPNIWLLPQQWTQKTLCFPYKCCCLAGKIDVYQIITLCGISLTSFVTTVMFTKPL